MGQPIAAGGVEQGETALTILANLPATANYICTKLCTLFVSDNPLPATIASAVTAFRNNITATNQIELVIRAILASAEFNDPASYHSKVKSPLEFAASVVRAVDGNTTGFGPYHHVQRMGMRIFENPEPTGWSELAVDWMTSQLLSERMKSVETLMLINRMEQQVINMVDLCRRNGATTPDAIVDFLLTRMLVQYPAEARTQALAFLGAGFALTDGGAENRLKELGIIVMCNPQFQYQ